MLLASVSATVARGERFLLDSFGAPAGDLAMLMVKAASEPELNAATQRIAEAVADFIEAVSLLSQGGEG